MHDNSCDFNARILGNSNNKNYESLEDLLELKKSLEEAYEENYQRQILAWEHGYSDDLSYRQQIEKSLNKQLNLIIKKLDKANQFNEKAEKAFRQYKGKGIRKKGVSG